MHYFSASGAKLLTSVFAVAQRCLRLEQEGNET